MKNNKIKITFLLISVIGIFFLALTFNNKNVLAAVPVATTGNATAITDSSATLNGVIAPNGTLNLMYAFIYWLEGDNVNTHATNLIPIVNGTNNLPVSENVTLFLAPNTKYVFQLLVEDSNTQAVVAKGAEKKFTTLKSNGVATTLNATNINLAGKSATLNGVVNAKNNADLEYYFSYWPDQSVNVKSTPHVDMSNSNADITVSANISQLTTDVKYIFQLIIRNKITQRVFGGLQKDFTIITPKIMATNITTTSVTLSAVGLEPSSPYVFEVRGSPGVVKQSITTDASGSISATLIKGLVANTDYTATVPPKNNPVTGVDPNAPLVNFKTVVGLGGNSNGNGNGNGNGNSNGGGGIDDPSIGGLVPCGNEPWSQYTYKKVDPATGIALEPVNIYTRSTKLPPLPKEKEANYDPKIKYQDIDLTGQAKNPCGFNHLIILVNKTINYVLFFLALPIAAIMFAYAGFLLLFSGGESGKKTKAKSIFTNVVIGVIIAIIAWLVVQLILSLLGYDGAWIGF